MQIIPSNDIEAIDYILAKIFTDKIPYWVEVEILRDLFESSYFHEVDRIVRKMKKLDLLSDNPSLKNVFCISDYSREILNEYHSYSNYLSANLSNERKKDKAVIFDRLIKNGNIIAALLISALSLVLTQFPIGGMNRQDRIEKGFLPLLVFPHNPLNAPVSRRCVF